MRQTVIEYSLLQIAIISIITHVRSTNWYFLITCGQHRVQYTYRYEDKHP